MSRFDAVSVRLAVGFMSLFACFSAVADGDWTGAPDYYVEYVASTSGGNQYIDTGVTAASPLLAEMEMAWVTVPSDGSFLATRPGDNRFYMLHNTTKRFFLWLPPASGTMLILR